MPSLALTVHIERLGPPFDDFAVDDHLVDAVERRQVVHWCRAASVSMIERRPRAPVLRGIAFWATARSASSVNVRLRRSPCRTGAGTA